MSISSSSEERAVGVGEVEDRPTMMFPSEPRNFKRSAGVSAGPSPGNTILETIFQLWKEVHVCMYLSTWAEGG